MGSLRFDGVRFVAYPQDHEPVHVHGFYAEVEVILELREGTREVAVAARPDAVRPADASRSDVKHILRVAAAHFDELIQLWREKRMPKLAQVVTTDAEIDAAIRQARIFAKYDQRALKATYSERTDRILVRMENGVTHSFPRKLLQGLSDAPSEALRKIERLGNGTGLYWPELDVAHSVSGLLAGVYGSAKWMQRLHLDSKKRIPA